MYSLEDNFSKQADKYSKFRPGYPKELFDYLAAQSPGRSLALDCGTGSGQAAKGLSEHYDKVIAVDLSINQLKNAVKSANINYLVSVSDKVGIKPSTVDIITAAQAAHWFNLDEFYREVKHLLKPGGVIALWTYYLAETKDEIDKILSRFDNEILRPYWSEKMKFVREYYKTLPFPFRELDAPVFSIELNWNLYELAGFLDSWSATQKFIELKKFNPVSLILYELKEKWGGAEKKRLIRWPLSMRIGKV